MGISLNVKGFSNVHKTGNLLLKPWHYHTLRGCLTWWHISIHQNAITFFS